MPAVLFSILTPLFCPSSSVSSSYFIFAVPMRECLGKHSCMSSQFPIAILNGTSSFLSLVQENMQDWTRLSDWTGLLFLPSSSVSLFYFNLAVPMRGCLGKHSCMSSPFSIGILNGTFSLRAPILFCGDVTAIK